MHIVAVVPFDYVVEHGTVVSPGSIDTQSAMAAGIVPGSIVGSKHDFSGVAAYGSNTQVCVFCHAPHNSVVASQLWNHAPTAATFTLYMLPAQAQENLCLKCHAPLAAKKEVHAAVHMGCASCHGEVDASTTPHKYKSKLAKGLTADGNALCANCHEKKLFEGKVLHGPVVSGPCLACHNPHSSDNQGLLTKAPATLCLDCHPAISKGPHVVAGFSQKSHPLGNEKKEAKDPLREGKKFYCASCHEPHRSDRPKLNRFGKGMDSCQKCHKM